MNLVFNFLQELWRQQLDFEVRRQSVRGQLFALKGILGSTRRIILFSLYVLLFLYSLFGLLTVAITSADLSQEAKPLVIYGLIAATFGGLLIYNLREETWIRRWGLQTRIQELQRLGAEMQSPAEPTSEEIAAQQMRQLLERFEERIEERLSRFERRQEARFKSQRYTAHPNGTAPRDMALY